MDLIYLAVWIYLLVFSVYHIIQGIVSVFFSNFALKLNERLYGFKAKEKEQLKMTLKPWGSLALVVGLIGLVVLSDVAGYSKILFCFGVLLLLRAGYRFVYRKDLYSYWKVSPIQNWRMIIIQLFGTILFFLFAFSTL